jgi:2-oxoglutarate ferredoxin oxidoreductase subunit beta
MVLASMDYPDFPVPVGVLRAVEHPTYDALLENQVRDARAASPPDFAALIASGETWMVG